MRSRKSDIIYRPEKVQKHFFKHKPTKKPLTSQNFKYSKTKYEVFQPKKDQTTVQVTIQEGMGEMSHKQQNLVLTSSLQFRKNYQSSLRRVAVRFGDRLLKQFFPLVQLVNCEISIIWMAVLRRQVNAYTVYFSCIMHLHKYLCLTFFNQHVLKRKMHYEMKQSGTF